MPFRLKKVSAMGTALFTVKKSGQLYNECTIETVDGEVYTIFTEKREAMNIGEIGASQIIELLATGSINNETFDIKPMVK